MRKFLKALAMFAGGSLVVFAVGLPWLYFWFLNAGPAVWQDYLGYDSLLAATLGAGLYPFLIGGLVKAVIAALLLPAAWWGANKLKANRDAD